MEIKNLRFCKHIVNFFLIIFIIASLTAFCFSIYNYVGDEITIAQYFYVAIGLFVLPIEIFTEKSIGFFINPQNRIYSVLTALILFIFFLSLLITYSKVFDKKREKKRKKHLLFSLISMFLIIAYLTFAVIVFAIKYTSIEKMFGVFYDGIKNPVEFLFENNILNIINISLSGLCVLLFFIVFIVLANFYRRKKKKEIQEQKLYFYTSVYEPMEEKKEKYQLEKISEEDMRDIPESNQKAKDLVTKIIQLEELRNEGKISDKEYVRLRQRSIKRYKK